MVKRAENEGFRMLDDFACEAIHDPAIPPAKPENQGTNAEMSIVEEIGVNATDAPTRLAGSDAVTPSPAKGA